MDSLCGLNLETWRAGRLDAREQRRTCSTGFFDDAFGRPSSDFWNLSSPSLDLASIYNPCLIYITVVFVGHNSPPHPPLPHRRHAMVARPLWNRRACVVWNAAEYVSGD